MPVREQPGLPVSALAAVALWGGSFAGVRVALDGFHPVGLTGLRLVVGAVLVAVLLILRKEPLLPRGRDRGRCVLLGLILGFHLAVQAYGLLYTSAIHTGWIIGFCPVTIAVGAHAFLGQRLSGRAWGGVAVATGGILLVTLESVPDFSEARFGDMLQLSTCVTWALYTLISIGAVKRNGALSVTGFAMAVAALILIACSTTTGIVVGTPGAREILALLFLGFFCSGVALTLWLHAQARYGTHRTGLTLYAEPFFVLIFSALLLGEPIQVQALLGGVTVLLGVWLATR